MNTDTTGFQPDVLLEKLDQDIELAQELLQAFLEDAPVRLEGLVRAVEAGDGSAASEAAHSLKGMCGVVRVQALMDLALTMEAAGRNDDVSKVSEVLDRFMPILEQVFGQVQEYLAQ